MRPISLGMPGQCGCSGYRKLAQSDNRAYVVVCGLAAYPTDAALEMILEDPRAAVWAPAWSEAAEEELYSVLLQRADPPVLWEDSWASDESLRNELDHESLAEVRAMALVVWLCQV